MKSKQTKSEQLNIEISSIIKKQIGTEPENGESISDLDPTKRITIKVTKPRKIHRKVLYRVLYPAEGIEIALIIPPTLSIAIARKGLANLKTLSILLHNDKPKELSVGARIHREYEELLKEFGWTHREHEQQVSFDILIAMLMMHREKKDSDIYKYAEIIFQALLDYVRIPETKLQDYIDRNIREIKNEKFPFSPDEGFFSHSTHQKLLDVQEEWNDDFSNATWSNEFQGILAGFWLVSFHLGYWNVLDREFKNCENNRMRRNQLIEKYLSTVGQYLPMLTQAGASPSQALENMLRQISKG